MSTLAEQDAVWEWLFRNQLSNVQQYACEEYLQGFELIQLPEDRVPGLSELNLRITPRTGWRAVRTAVRYSDTLPWYQHFARKEFIVTNYLRSWQEVEFTPEPDMFHDIFGHLPFLTLPEYTELFDRFTSAYLRANPGQQEDLKRLAWFSYEFGLIEENGRLKIFGAGILSSAGETKHVMAGQTPLKPFTIENVLRRNKAIASYNQELFVFPSLEELKRELVGYFETLGDDQASLQVKGSEPIQDKEMDLSRYL